VIMRLGKTFGFGGERGAGASGGASGQRGPSGPEAATGRGMGSIIGPATTNKRYNLSISMDLENIINHNNPGPVIGNITSPLFGQANQPAGARDLGGGGFSESANNRRLELQIRFTF
jgi:hypothetical protein